MNTDEHRFYSLTKSNSIRVHLCSSVVNFRRIFTDLLGVKMFLLGAALAVICPVILNAQVAGGRATGNKTYEQQIREPQTNSGALTAYDSSGKIEFYYVEASVLMNVPAESYLAVFGAAAEGKTAAESNTKVNAQIADFTRGLEAAGVRAADTYVDFIAQTPVYDFTTTGTTVRERLSGFETKKTVAVKYRDRNQLERLIVAGANAGIFDLVKVDYVIADMNPIRKRLFDEAVKIIKQKEASYTGQLGIKLQSKHLANEKFDVLTPGERYDTYQAFETGDVSGGRRTVVEQRKSTTFYYEPVSAKGFDTVINQVGLEPVVQCTLYLRMQYSLPEAKQN